MDGVLVDFESGLAQQDEQTLKEYEGRYDEIPGMFPTKEWLSRIVKICAKVMSW